jgi:hypothetical protein
MRQIQNRHRHIFTQYACVCQTVVSFDQSVMEQQHVYTTTTKHLPIQGSRFVGVMYTCFLRDIQRERQAQGREAPLWGAPKARPCCFRCISDRNQVYTKHGYAPKKLLSWKSQFLVVVYTCCYPILHIHWARYKMETTIHELCGYVCKAVVSF